jgi:hypothetical protein
VLVDLARQRIDIDRLGDVSIQPGIDCLLAVAFHHVRRERNNRCFAQLRELPQKCGAVVAINIRQVDVHQNQIGVYRFGFAQTNVTCFSIEDRKTF